MTRNQIEKAKERIGNLNVDSCVKFALLDELNKAEFFFNDALTCEPEQKERRMKNALSHLRSTESIGMAIERYQKYG